MRMPRVRITIRRTMIAVAIVALLLVVAIPFANSLIWLYNTPHSVDGIGGSLNPRYLIAKPVSVGQSVPVDCPYECESYPWICPWLPYRVVVEVKLIDASTGNFTTGTVEETHQQTHLLFNGIASWRKVRGELKHSLTPRHPGGYFIRYEIHATDLFGRKGMAACHTGGVSAR